MDFTVQSHQGTQYETDKRPGSRKTYRNCEDKTNRPRIQSAQHSVKQNFENRELQQSKATSLRGPSYRRRKEDHVWRYKMPYHEDNNNEDNDNVWDEDPPRLKPGQWNRTSDREKLLKQANRSSSQQGYGPPDKWKHENQGHFPSDKWNCGDQGHIPFGDRKHGNRDHVPPDKWKHGDQGRVPSDDWGCGDRGHVPSDKWKPGDQGHVFSSAWECRDPGHFPPDKWNHGDQGHVPFDNWKHGDRGHVPSDKRKPGGQGHVPSSAWECGDQGHVQPDKWNRGDQGHVPFDDWKHGDRGHVPSDKWKPGDQGHVPSDKWKPGDHELVPSSAWECGDLGHVPSDKWKPGDHRHVFSSAWECRDPGHFPPDKWNHGDQGHAPFDNWKHGDRGHVPSDDWGCGDGGHVPSDKWNRGDQGHVPFDDWKHGDRGHVPSDKWKPGDQGHVPSDKWKPGDHELVPSSAWECGDLGHVPSDKWKPGDQGHVFSSAWECRDPGHFPPDKWNHGDQGHVPFDNWKHGDRGHVPSDKRKPGGQGHVPSSAWECGDQGHVQPDKWNRGDQGHVPFDDWKHGDLGHVPSDKWKPGDHGHVPSDKCKPGGQGHIPSDKWRSGDHGHIPSDDWECGDRGNVPSDKWKPGDYRHIPSDKWRPGDNGHIPSDKWRPGDHEHIPSDKWKPGDRGHVPSGDWECRDQGAACADGQNWENCMPGVMEFLRSVRPYNIGSEEFRENQSTVACEKGGDSHDETNSTTKKEKAEELESQQVNEFKDSRSESDCNTDNNEASGEAGRAIGNESLAMFGEDGHDKINSTANKEKVGKIKSQQSDEFKDGRSASDCNTGNNEASGEAGKAIGIESLAIFDHDKTDPIVNKEKAGKKMSQKVKGKELNDGKNKPYCKIDKNEASGEAGKAIGNDSLAMFDHDITDSTANKEKAGKKISQKVNGEESKDGKNKPDCKIDKNEASGEAGKAIGNDSLATFGHDITDSTANKEKAGKKISQKVKGKELKNGKNKLDCIIEKNEAIGEPGKTMGNDSLARFPGDGHDKTDSVTKKIKATQKKSQKVNDDELKDNRNKSDCNTGKNEATGEAVKTMGNESLARLAGDGRDKTNSTANKVKAGKKISQKEKQGDELNDDRNKSQRNIGKNEASRGAGKVVRTESLAMSATGEDDGHSKRASKNKVRYTAEQKRAETNDGVDEQRDTEIGVQTGRRKTDKSQKKFDGKPGIVFYRSPKLRYRASNHEGRYTDDESSVYQNQGRCTEVNNADDGGCRRAGKDGFKLIPEQKRDETIPGVGQERDSYSEISFPTGKQKTGKSKTKLDGKTSTDLKNSLSKCKISIHDGSHKDGGPLADEKKTRGRKKNNLKIVEEGESYDDKKDGARTLIISSDISGKGVQSSLHETERRTNFKLLSQIVKKQLEANARYDAKHKERQAQQTNQDLSRNWSDDKRVQTNTKTNFGTVSLDKESSNTSQNSQRGPQNLKSLKTLVEEPISEKESGSLNPCPALPMVPFAKTHPVKNPDKANMTASFAEGAGTERREPEVDKVRRQDSPIRQLMFEQCFPTDKRLLRFESRMNSPPLVHGLQATFRSADGIDIESVWNKVMTEAKIRMGKHRAKSVQVREQLSDLEGEKAKKKWVTIDEYERRLETRVPLKKKIYELEKQEQEFHKSLDQLKKEFDLLKVESRPKKSRVNFLRSKFSLELKRFETALPLYARKSDIVDTVLANRVSIILGETGSGKSTQILQYLYEAGLSRHGILVCTQPRKVAALSLARHVAQEMGCKLGNLVGYHVGSKYCHGPNTHLMYVTDNALLNDCLKDAMFTKYSCIVIDEAHERSIYTDLLLGFVKKALAVRKELKVVIASATIDAEVFVRYLSSGNFVPPVLEISGRAFPVDVYYEESTEDYVMAACDKALEVHWTEPPGDILVFLSSPIETERACKRFQIQIATGEAVMMELHGRLQAEDQQKVFEILPLETRKVVFATNCAETSITIPGIKYVIDTGRVREVSYDPLKNMSSLQLTWVNKSSAEQRKGRAGRTDCGKCFRLYTEEQYKHDMRPVSVPEILRVHLGQALLKISSLGVSNPSEFEFVESPSVAAIENAMLVLRELGAYGNRGITDSGRKLAKIALEPRLGKAALLGVEQKIAYEALVMAVIASFGGNVFFRVGTEEQKQQADKRKTRFCDQWGDIVTLVNVYKEWDAVPKNRQGAWCVENSINGKSMKMAREMLREMLKTFRQDLKVTIRRRWSRCADLNYRLAKIIFHCYSSNLCRFSGHPRGGYCLARLPNVSLQLHPSSAFNYMEDFPRWVVYEQVFSTSRTFMQNTTYVDESWIKEKIGEGCLDGSVFYGFERYLLEPSIVCTIGASCMNRLLSGKAQELKQMESCLKNLSDEGGEKVLIDLLPPDGTVTVYTTKLLKESAAREINARISVIRKSIQDECIEQPIRTGATVQLILEKGAKIRTILMPTDSRQVKVSRVANEFVGDVEELLSVYGEIETVRLLDHKKDSQAQDQRDTWGFVTYKLPETARKVLEDATMLPFQLELQKQVLQLVNRIEDFKVKVKVCRRRQRDFGFARFKDAFHATLALASVNSIRVENRGVPCPANFLNDYVFPVPNCNPNVQLISVIPDSKNSKQMYLKRIPQWADKKMIWDALAKAVGKELVIEEVTIARERPPPAVLSAALFAEFCQAIRSKLWINGNLWEFQLQAVPPADRAYYMTAYVAFSNAYQAQVARDLLNDSLIIGSKAVAKVELRTSIFVSGQIFRLLGARILAETEAAVSSSGGGLNIQMAERRNGSHSIQLEAKSLDLLKEGKARIDGIINGLEVNLDLKRFSHLKSSDSKRFLELLQRETQAILRLDERRQAVYVHGGAKSAEEVKNRLCKYLFTDFPERVVDIQLRGSGSPNGLMKVLVVKYGSNLERLKDLSGATTVELFLRKHMIQVQGSDESVQRLKELIEGEAGRITRRDAPPIKSSRPNCPVCLGPVERESSYIMEYCGHSYCKECALSLIDNGLENNEIPIQCAAEGCSQDVTIRDLRNLPVNISKVFDTAIRAFVQTNSTEFGYCITADCPMVYRKARENKNGELFQCSECQLRLCTACASEFHHGISCEVYRCLQGEENDIKTWLTERPKDRSLCPQCKMGIEKNGGCMHVECTACRVHICWRCKTTFSASAQCYDHLTKCGGIFGLGNENFVL